MEKGMTDITDMVFSETNEEREEKSVDAIESGEEVEEKINSSEIINNLSPRVRDGDGDDSKNGGIMNSLISGILHPIPRSGGGDEEGEGSAVGAGDERERGGDNDTDSDGGGGLIDNLVSHLPGPLADDAAPGTEEASILIHSVVRD